MSPKFFVSKFYAGSLGRKSTHQVGPVKIESTFLLNPLGRVPTIKLSANKDAKGHGIFFGLQNILDAIRTEEGAQQVLESLQQRSSEDIRAIGLMNRIRQHTPGQGWIHISPIGLPPSTAHFLYGEIPMIFICHSNGGINTIADVDLEVEIEEDLDNSQRDFPRSGEVPGPVFRSMDGKRGQFPHAITVVIKVKTSFTVKEIESAVARRCGVSKVRLGIEDGTGFSEVFGRCVRFGWWGPNTRLGKLYPSGAFPTHAAVNMVPYMYAVSVGEDPYDGMVDEDDLIKKAKPLYQYERDKALERFRLRLDYSSTPLTVPGPIDLTLTAKAAEDVPSPVIFEDGTEYEVGKILTHRFDNGIETLHHLRFKIRWKGYTAKDDTWEPYSSLEDNAALDRYAKLNPGLPIPNH
jgi:hypothetical protein